MRRCAFKHQALYTERWSGKQTPMSALAKGTAWHSVMEEHYRVIQLAQQKNVPDSNKVLAACRRKVAALVNDMPEEMGELIWWMYDGYIGLYGCDWNWKILGVEHPAEVRLPTLTGGPSSFKLKVKIDLVVQERASGRIRVVDHKSGKDLPKEKALDLDDQFALYVWCLQRMGKSVFGATYNAARTYRLVSDLKEPGTTPLEERFQRVSLYRTEKELEIIASEAYLTALARYRQQAEVIRAGTDAPRTTDPTRCGWDCDIYQACLLGRKGLDWRDHLRRTGFEQRFERH
jgi:hypothetical protein